MPFEAIENLGAAKPAEAVPPVGVVVRACHIVRKKGGVAHFIRLTIGAELAKSLGFHADQHGVQILFGTGKDAGKLCISVDNQNGQFQARRRANKAVYTLSINGRSADGLFATDFPPITISRLEVVKPENGGPRQCVFPISAEMLNADG